MAGVIPVLDKPPQADYQGWLVESQARIGLSVVKMEEVVESASLSPKDPNGLCIGSAATRRSAGSAQAATEFDAVSTNTAAALTHFAAILTNPATMSTEAAAVLTNIAAVLTNIAAILTNAAAILTAVAAILTKTATILVEIAAV